MPPPRILLVLAHPDDESFIAAGLVRGHADRGARTALVTATRGDAGRVGDPPLCDRAELPAVREAELRRAAAILGISEVQLLDYRDKHLAEAPVNAMREALVRHIRGHRPHVVIGFDPDGMNGHPDHVAIARFTIDAVAAAARSAVDGRGGAAVSGAAPSLDHAGPAVGGDTAPGTRPGAGRRLRRRRGGTAGGEGGRAAGASPQHVPILEDLDQSGREPGMETGVDFIEQKDVTALKRGERLAYQVKPSPGSGRCIVQIENDRFTLSTMNETKVTTRLPVAAGLFFPYRDIVDCRVRDA